MRDFFRLTFWIPRLLIMQKEIEILLKAASKGCLAVEKASNMVWDTAELMEARESGRFQEMVCFLPPDGRIEVSSPYPGCLQQVAATETSWSYRIIGHTDNFIIFARPNVGAAPKHGGAPAGAQPLLA
jgi:hypothetical protein